MERRPVCQGKAGMRSLSRFRRTFRETQTRPARPAEKPRKALIALRLEQSTVQAYKAGGRGYQTRMAAVLAEDAK